jgi:hypothetical protein
VDRATLDAVKDNAALVWRELDSLTWPASPAPVSVHQLLPADLSPSSHRAMLVYADALKMYALGVLREPIGNPVGPLLYWNSAVSLSELVLEF